jgi:hypothetical protein
MDHNIDLKDLPERLVEQEKTEPDLSERASKMSGPIHRSEILGYIPSTDLQVREGQKRREVTQCRLLSYNLGSELLTANPSNVISQRCRMWR